MKYRLLVFSTLILAFNQAFAERIVLDELIKAYQVQGANNPDALRGQKLWSQTFVGQTPFKQRSCSSCHTERLQQTGEHIRTGKSISPMAPSVNRKSLGDITKVIKWLKRNCKWTLGRECNAQEKSDLLTFIRQQ